MKSLYYTNVLLENMRTFGIKQNINLCDENGNPSLWNIIIGDNGTGKTTILKALSLPLIRPWGNTSWLYNINLNTFDRYNEKHKSDDIKHTRIEIDFLYDKKENETLALDLTLGEKQRDIHTIYTKNVKNNAIFDPEFEKDYLLFAYGASRYIGRKGMSSGKDFPAQTLFEDNVPLMNTEEWLLQVELKAEKNQKFKSYKEKVFKIVKHLLQGEVLEIKTDVENSPQILFKTQYGWVRLHELSLGYKTLLSWVVDFAKGMLEKYSESNNPLAEPAICLVDEIDLHIHPALQKKVINFLKDTFSKTQFIVTTHSPLILQAVDNANVILLKDKGNSVIAMQNSLDIDNWRIDQILMSDLFELKDIYQPAAQKKIDRHLKLLRKGNLTEKEQKELQTLTEFVENLPVGHNQKEIEGFEIIKKFAKNISENKKI